MAKGENRVCKICASNDVELWTKSDDFEYATSEQLYSFFKCNACISLFIEPMPVDKLSLIYPSNYYSFSTMEKTFALKVKEYLDNRLFKKMLTAIQREKINVLDVGGGSGWLLDGIKKIEERVALTQVVDIDEKAMAIAESKGHHYFHGTIEAFTTDQTFDLVLMLNLIEHVSDPLQTILKIEQLLNPGGKVLLKTPNIDSLDARLFRHSYWGGLHCPRHWVLFSKRSFTQMIGKSNLKINYINYTQGAPFWAYSVLSKLQNYGLVKIDSQRPAVNHPLFSLISIFFAGFDFIRGALGFKTSQMFIELEKR